LEGYFLCKYPWRYAVVKIDVGAVRSVKILTLAANGIEPVPRRPCSKRLTESETVQNGGSVLEATPWYEDVKITKRPACRLGMEAGDGGSLDDDKGYCSG